MKIRRDRRRILLQDLVIDLAGGVRSLGEIDGIQHAAENAIADSLRHNTIAAAGDIVLRLPVLGLRVCPDAFFDQVAQALRNAGCPLPDRRSA
ncbi:MAG: hypothetical protein L0H93_21850 [Nocardioides sp.]|nr:hypothetical protein [Nocardioides sp.]